MSLRVKDTIKGNNFEGTINNYSIEKSVPANAIFTDTNTWRGIQDNLTSTSVEDSLSANQGKTLKALVDGKANSSHGTHISDSGWKNLSLASGLSVPADGVSRYRKINNIVYVQINLQGLSHGGSSSSAVNKTIGTLPSAYRPSAYLPIDGTAGATISNPCRFESNTDGTIRFRSATNKITGEYTVHLSYSFMI